MLLICRKLLRPEAAKPVVLPVDEELLMMDWWQTERLKAVLCVQGSSGGERGSARPPAGVEYQP